MPDFTIEAHYHCMSAESWETEASSSRPGEPPYTVRWGRVHSGNTQFDWTCNCAGFRFGHGKPCRHIKAVKESGKWCGWMGFSDPGKVGIDADGNPTCPRCGGPCGAMNWAV